MHILPIAMIAVFIILFLLWVAIPDPDESRTNSDLEEKDTGE